MARFRERERERERERAATLSTSVTSEMFVERTLLIDE